MRGGKREREREREREKVGGGKINLVIVFNVLTHHILKYLFVLHVLYHLIDLLASLLQLLLSFQQSIHFLLNRNGKNLLMTLYHIMHQNGFNVS